MINDKFTTVETSPETVIFRRFRKTAKRYYEFRHVCLSVRSSTRMEQLGSHGMNFHEIWYLGIFRICVEDIQD